ncbi:MAG: hypothetical protein K2N78_02600 [Oscillospiraceae bacterium]|nr:hypothetical protein [Oscillospiraceae bacterium]
MVGKIILGVIAGLLLLIVLILQIPLRLRFAYDQGDMSLAVRFGPVKLQLLPRPEKEKPKKKKKPKKEKAEKEKKPKKPKAKINREQILYALEKLPPILGRALKRTGKSIRIEPLKAYVLVAGYDPADTAQLYGRLEAALSVGLPLLEQAIRIKDEDVRLYWDFTERQMDCIADVGIALRPWSLVTVGVRALASLIKWYFGFRKLASPPPAAEPEADAEAKKDTKKDTSEAA